VSGEEARVLAEEQAALRRVATLVARGVPPEDVFAAVTEEAGRVLRAEMTNMCRYEPDGALTVVASVEGRWHWSIGSRWPPGSDLGALVLETGRPARMDKSDAGASGAAIDRSREIGIRHGVAAPIVVEGRVWGVIGVGTSRAEPPPADTEARLSAFTELLATAIANAESRAGLARLAEEQAALRRVATLVARGVAAEEVFAAVTEEVGRLLAVKLATMCRFESDGTFAIVAIWGRAGQHVLVGSGWPLGGQTSARSYSTRGVRRGSTTLRMRPARSLRTSARTVFGLRSRR
jgi:GAF domain-containing protein